MGQVGEWCGIDFCAMRILVMYCQREIHDLDIARFFSLSKLTM